MRIVNKKKFIKSISILVILLLALFDTSIAKIDKREAETVEYTITSGETLWSISKKYTPVSKDIRQTISEIKELNNMNNSNIYVGQIIKLKEKRL